MGELGGTHGLFEGLPRVTKARVIDNLRQEVIDVGGADQVFVRGERATIGDAHAGREMLRRNRNALDFDELSHALVPSVVAPLRRAHAAMVADKKTSARRRQADGTD